VSSSADLVSRETMLALEMGTADAETTPADDKKLS
jgi:hypothetical protein